MADPVTKDGYVLEFDETFGGTSLDRSRWMPWYLPQWASREASAARYVVDDGVLRLRIEADQGPWAPDLDGDLRVSNLQTGVLAGPVGSDVGQHGVHAGVRVREEQQDRRLYTPTYGVVELVARAVPDPRCLAALWMIGYEETPEQSAEICVAEIFGSDVGETSARVGMGLHPFDDPALTDDFEAVPVPIDAREAHTYTVEWLPGRTRFFVDGACVKQVDQAPGYPMQLMLNLYEFPPGPDARPDGQERYPKEFVVESVRGYRPAGMPPAPERGEAVLPDPVRT